MAFALTVGPVTEINGVADDQVTLILAGCTAGRAIVGGCYWSHATSTITSITATGESNAQLIGSPARNAGANGDASVQLFYFQNLAGSGDKTIQANFSAVYGGVGFFAFEVSGGHATLPDTNAGWHAEGTGNSGTPSIALATNQDNDLIVAMVAGGTGADPNPGSGFTIVAIDQYGVRNAGEYDLDAGAAGTPSVGFTLGSADEYAIAAAAFRVAAAGGVVNTSTLTDTVTPADDIVRSAIRGNVSSDTLTVVDSFFLWWYRTRVLQSSVVVTEGSLETYTTTNMQAIDELTISDELVAWLRRTRLLDDSIAITDELIASVIGYLIFISTLTSQLTITDEALPLRYFTRLLESDLLTADQAMRSTFVARSFLDTVDVTDENLTALQRFILLTDALSIDDSLSSLLVSPVTSNPVIVIGFGQPRIEIGGYGL